MALSLADELAAFDDGEQGGGGGGGALGMSLAAEFGFSLDGQGGGGPHGQLDDLDLDMGQNTGMGDPLNSIDRADQQPGDLFSPSSKRQSQATCRSAKSSCSSYDNSTHDGTNADAFLDDDHHHHLEAIATGSYLDSHVFNDHGLDRAASVPPPCSGQEDGRSRAGSVRSTTVDGSPMKNGGAFLGVKADKDPLVELQEIVEGTRPFLALVSSVDGATGATVSRVEGKEGQGQVTLEARLQALLTRLHGDEKKRKEQIRELVSMSRDLSFNAGLRQDHDAPLDWSRLSSVAEGEGEDEDEDEDEGQEPGWTGDPTQVHDQQAHHTGFDDGHGPDDHLNDMDSLPGQPPPAFSPLTSLASLHPLPQTGPLPSLQPLPRTLRLLQSNTHDLVTTLAHLSDTLHSTTSMSTSNARQIRGIKAGVDSWREREIAEDAARDAIEAYERKRLEQGLRAQGTGKSIREILDREVQEFQEVLDGAQCRMEQIRREANFRFALA